MARKPKTKPSTKSATRVRKPKRRVAGPKKTIARIDESALAKGELRKLNALRKSVGDELGDRTFVRWLRKRPPVKDGVTEDKNAVLIAETLNKLIDEKGLRIRRGGYIVTRGRGRVIVERPEQS